MTPGKLIRGAAGLAKAGLQLAGFSVDEVPATVLLERRDHCRECPAATKSPHPRYAVNKGLTALSVCRDCDCNIAAKDAAGVGGVPEGQMDHLAAGRGAGGPEDRTAVAAASIDNLGGFEKPGQPLRL
jgi:hypothetical protein